MLDRYTLAGMINQQAWEASMTAAVPSTAFDVERTSHAQDRTFPLIRTVIDIP